MPDFLNGAIFETLTKKVQLRFDAITRLNKQLFDNVVFENYLTWDVPSIGLTFDEIMGLYSITIAAATLGDNSNEPVIGYEAPAELQQKVLLHALTRKMTAQDYRKILSLQQSAVLNDTASINQLVDLMFGEAQYVVDAVLSKLDMIFLTALSNEGVCELNETNNPEGGFKSKIDYGMPDGNKFVATELWTSDNIDTVNVLDDIERVVEAADGKVVFEKILMDRKQLAYMTRTGYIRKAIWGSDKSATPVTQTVLNQFLAENDLPQVEVIRRHVQVQDHGKLATVKPWNANNIVFVPAGSLGVVKNAYADSELQPEDGITYSNYGRIRVSQWGVGEKENSRSTQFTKAQVYALPVITAMDGISSMKVSEDVATTSAKKK